MGAILLFFGGIFGAIKCIDSAIGDWDGLRQAWENFRAR